MSCLHQKTCTGTVVAVADSEICRTGQRPEAAYDAVVICVMLLSGFGAALKHGRARLELLVVPAQPLWGCALSRERELE